MQKGKTDDSREREKSFESKQENMALCFLSGGFDPMILAGAITVQRKGSKGRDHRCRGRIGSVMVGANGHPILMASLFFMKQEYQLQLEMRQKKRYGTVT